MGEAVIHLLQGVHDEIDRRPQRVRDAEFARQPFVGGRPVGDAICDVGAIDDDQQVEVGLVAFGRMRLVDPAAPRVAAVEDDLRYPARLALAGGERDASSNASNRIWTMRSSSRCLGGGRWSRSVRIV